MRRWMGLGVAVLLSACGPPIKPPPEVVEDAGCTGNCQQPEQNVSLWPMTAGSSWTYKITDTTGVWEKTVTVVGEQAIPGTDRTGTLFKSVQPHLEEHSWQIADGPFAKRVREEDLQPDGTLKRVTTWDPLTIKALTSPQAVGWENRITVNETVFDALANSTEVKQKEFAWKVVAVDQEIVVNGTSYRAIKVERDRDVSGKERYYWLVPGVGKVREEGERTEELLRFDVK